MTDANCVYFIFTSINGGNDFVFIDGRTLPQGAKVSADVCIIGTGPAGITLARNIASDKVSVICIESGGMEPDVATQDLTKGDSVGLPYYPLETTRLRYFGGTTGHWGGYCRPLYPIDFEKRDWVPQSGWPISYLAVAEYYPAAQEICDLGPFDYALAGWQLPNFPPLPLGGNEVQTRLIQFSPPTRFNTKYRDEFTRSKRVTVYLNANVASIDASANAKEIVGLAVKTLSGNRFSVRARIYVLAAGGIENVRLLLASSQVTQHGLANDRDNVGRYFCEHMQLDSAAVLPLRQNTSYDLYQPETRHKPFEPVTPGSPIGLMGYLTFTDEAQRAGRILNYSANVQHSYWSDYFLHSDRTHDSADESRWQALGSAIATVWHNLKDAGSMAWERLPGKKSPGFYKIVTSQEQAPNRDSRVLLSNSTDALGIRRASLDWRLNELDRHTITHALRQIGSAFGSAGLARLQVPIDFAKDSWPAYIRGSWHHCGGTRMSESPDAGVVDSDCKVHGIGNLYVAGASVFPTNGHGNPTLTVVALALRMAAHIRGVLR